MIRHLKSTDTVIVDRHPLIGNAILLDRRINLDVLNELGNHALCNGGSIDVAAQCFQESIHIHPLIFQLLQLQPDIVGRRTFSEAGIVVVAAKEHDVVVAMVEVESQITTTLWAFQIAAKGAGLLCYGMSVLQV